MPQTCPCTNVDEHFQCETCKNKICKQCAKTVSEDCSDSTSMEEIAMFRILYLCNECYRKY